MNDAWVLDVLLLVCLELIEANGQKGKTFGQLVNYLYALFVHKPVRFILLHLSLAYTLYLMSEYAFFNGWIGAILVIKSIDLIMKLSLFRGIKKRGHFSTLEFYGIPDPLIRPWMRYFGVILYPLLLTAAFVTNGG